MPPMFLAHTACIPVLVLTAAAAAVPTRARAAEGPAPYQRVEVRFVAGDTTLAGTLYQRTGRAVAGLVVAPGSGPSGRDFPFYVQLADALARAGVTVLVYDKRGVGGSGGRYDEVPDFVRASDDLGAACGFLRSRLGADSARVGVLGVSQGGWTGAAVAARAPAPAFYIGVSTPGVSTLDQNLHERTRQLVESGYSPSEVDEITVLRRQLWTYYRTGEGHEALRLAWQEARSRPWFARLGWGESCPTLADLSESQQRSFRGVGYFDPAPPLRDLRIPTLLVFGDRDAHIDVARALVAHRSAFGALAYPDTSLVVLPGLGHLLQPVSERGECLTCPHQGEMPRTDPIAYSTIVGWLRARFAPSH